MLMPLNSLSCQIRGKVLLLYLSLSSSPDVLHLSDLSQAQAGAILDQVTCTDLLYAVADYPIQAPVYLTSLYGTVLAPLLPRAFPSDTKLGHHYSLLQLMACGAGDAVQVLEPQYTHLHLLQP